MGKMKRRFALSAEERRRFIAAASALLAKEEKMEFLREQVKEQLRGESGEVQMPSAKIENVHVSARKLLQVLDEIYSAHPGVHGMSFRGRIFNLVRVNGQPVLSVIKAANVVDIGQ